MSLVVILPGPEDLGAGQVAASIRRRGGEVVVVPGYALEESRWEHHIVDGLSHTVIRLPDGQLLADETIGAVLNRLSGPTTRNFARSDERDRTYAAVEWEALFLAWLSSLGGRVLGCPTAVTAAGQVVPGDLRWHAWARRAGLLGPCAVTAPAATWAGANRQEGVERWTVVGSTVLRRDEVVGGDTAACVRALAGLAGVDLLDVLLRRTQAGDEFVSADLRPALTPGVGEALANRLLTCSRRSLGAAS